MALPKILQMRQLTTTLICTEHCHKDRTSPEMLHLSQLQLLFPEN
jgi:hypothetical protein